MCRLVLCAGFTGIGNVQGALTSLTGANNATLPSDYLVITEGQRTPQLERLDPPPFSVVDATELSNLSFWYAEGMRLSGCPAAVRVWSVTRQALNLTLDLCAPGGMLLVPNAGGNPDGGLSAFLPRPLLRSERFLVQVDTSSVASWSTQQPDQPAAFVWVFDTSGANNMHVVSQSPAQDATAVSIATTVLRVVFNETLQRGG